MSKFIYAPSADTLQGVYQSYNVGDLQSNPIYRSIAITGDGFMYTHGKKFRLFLINNGEITGLHFSITDGLASLYDGVASLGNGNVVTGITGDDNLTATYTKGNVTIVHNSYFNNATQLSSGDTLTNLGIPQFNIDKYGHITSVSTKNIDITLVKASALTTENDAYYLIGVKDNSTLAPYYNTDIYINKDGYLRATKLYEGVKSLSELYAGIGHLLAYATDSVYGHVLLTDTANIEQDVNTHYAVTPKGLATTLASANQYTQDLVAAQDAIVFAGTIKPNGVIVSHNSDLFNVTDNVNTISELPSYKVGYTFRFTESGNFGTEAVETGDMLITIKDKGSLFNYLDFTIIQTNIDGALTTTENLSGKLLYGDGNTSITGLTMTNGVLSYSNGTLSFVNPNTLWRPIKVNNTSIGTSELNLIEGNYILLSTDDLNSGDVTMTVNTSTLFAVASTLLFISTTDANNSIAYKPNANSTIYVGGGIDIGTYTLQETSYKLINLETLHSNLGFSGFGTVAVDKYGRVTSITEISALPNAAAFKILDDSNTEIISYLGDIEKRLKFSNGTDIGFTFQPGTGENPIVTVTPSITHKYRPINYVHSVNNSSTSTSVLVDSNANAFTIVEGDHITLRTTDSNGNNLGAGSLAIDAVWRGIEAYKYQGNAWAKSSLGDTALVFDESLMSSSDGIGLYWTEIDSEGRVSYVK